MILFDGKEEEGRVLTWRGDGSRVDIVSDDGERVVPTTGDEEVEEVTRTCDSTTRTEEFTVIDWVELGIACGGFGV